VNGAWLFRYVFGPQLLALHCRRGNRTVFRWSFASRTGTARHAAAPRAASTVNCMAWVMDGCGDGHPSVPSSLCGAGRLQAGPSHSTAPGHQQLAHTVRRARESRLTRPLFRCEIFFLDFVTVVLSFVYVKYCPIIDQLGLKDLSRDLQANCVISICFRLYLVFHACATIFDVTGNLEIFFEFWWELNKALVNLFFFKKNRRCSTFIYV